VAADDPAERPRDENHGIAGEPLVHFGRPLISYGIEECGAQVRVRPDVEEEVVPIDGGAG
jgi:hypothetical protein